MRWMIMEEKDKIKRLKIQWHINREMPWGTQKIMFIPSLYESHNKLVIPEMSEGCTG